MSLFDALPAIFTGVLGETEPFILKRPGLADLSFTGIWTERYVAADGGSFADIDSKSAAVDAETALLGAVEQDDDARIERTKTGATYRLRSVQPDGEGMTSVVLQLLCPE